MTDHSQTPGAMGHRLAEAANLASAAPDMLEALKLVDDWHSHRLLVPIEGVMVRVRAAIAKAEGGVR